MEITVEENKGLRRVSAWSVMWFLFHLTAVYALVHFVTPWFAGWTLGTLFPILGRQITSGRFEFLFTHIFVFSFGPALLAGLVNARLRHKAAQLVWLVPTAILVYKFATF